MFPIRFTKSGGLFGDTRDAVLDVAATMPLFRFVSASRISVAVSAVTLFSLVMQFPLIINRLAVVNDKGLLSWRLYYSSADNRRHNGGDVSKSLTAFQSAVDFAVAGNTPDSVAVVAVVLLPAGRPQRLRNASLSKAP